MIPGIPSRRRFSDLGDREILALAISSEEDDARIYRTYAERLREDYPSTAAVFEGMAGEEDRHRQRLIEMHRKRFGETIPLLRREHVSGFYARRPVWLVENLGLERMREEAEIMERDAQSFYERAAARTSDAGTRKLLGDLAAAEAGHTAKADMLMNEYLGDDDKSREDRTAHRRFILTWVQPGLAGLMDGSVSTLAPIFATAFATQDPWTTFLVGLAASVGAGISMGFTEAASDDGDGLHRSGIGRWPDLRARLALETRFRLGGDDHPGRAGPRPALSHPRFLDRDHHRHARRLHRTLGDRVDPEPVHGNAILPRRPSGRARGRSGARRGHPDRVGLEQVAQKREPVLSLSDMRIEMVGPDRVTPVECEPFQQPAEDGFAKKARAQGPGQSNREVYTENYPVGARGFLDRDQATSR